MKSIFKALFIVLLVFSNQLWACDVCGCAAGTNYMGVLPQFSKNLFGFRYQYSNSLHPSTNFNTNDLDSRVLQDQFYTTEAWLRYYPAERWQLFAFVPYSVHKRIETERTTTIQGLGDIRLNLNYTLIDTDSSSSKWKNLLLVGGGVNLPTGKYQQRDDTRLMLPAAFQVGRGAFSYNLNAIHTLRYNAWGLNTNLQYIFRGQNELSYDWGDRFSGATSLFYWGQAKSFSYLPSAGVAVNYFEQDYQYDELKPYTGGTLVSMQFGLDIYINRWLINTFVQVPLSQDIPSQQPGTGFNAGVGLSMFFGKAQGIKNEEQAAL